MKGTEKITPKPGADDTLRGSPVRCACCGARPGDHPFRPCMRCGVHVCRSCDQDPWAPDHVPEDHCP